MRRLCLTVLCCLFAWPALAQAPAFQQGQESLYGLVDVANPVNRTHYLAKGLVNWYLVLPGWHGTGFWYDLMKRIPLPLVNMASGVSTSGFSPTTRPGGFGELRFDGTNDTAQAAPSGYPFPNPNFSITAMARQESPTTGDRTIYDHQLGAFGLYLRLNKVNFYNGGNHIGATAVGTSVWNCIGVTYDGVNIRVWLNGVVDGTFAETLSSYPDATTTVSLGAHNGFDIFAGALDDVRLYERALSSHEMYDQCVLMKRGNPGLLNMVPLSVMRAVESIFQGSFFPIMGN